MPFDACYHAVFYCDICRKHIDCFGQTFGEAKKEAETKGWKIKKSIRVALCPEHINATKPEIELAQKKYD